MTASAFGPRPDPERPTGRLAAAFGGNSFTAAPRTGPADASTVGIGAAPLGVIGGSAFLEAGRVPGAEIHEIGTTRGAVRLHVGRDFVFLQRHGEGVYRPPHRIPHHAHVLALDALGVRHVLGFASSGSLHVDLAPGGIVVPDDYLSWHDPPTFAEDEYLHVVPALDPGLRSLLVLAAERAVGGGAGALPGAGPTVEDGGIYVETRGPRFETAAEVRLLAAHGRVVGMTAASEATLLQEKGIAYAMICTVDNWANGVGAPPLTLERFQEQLARGARSAMAIFERVLELWRESRRARR